MEAWGLSRVPVIYELIRGDPKYLVRLDKLKVLILKYPTHRDCGKKSLTH